MKEVTVVFTSHTESDAFGSKDLVAILESLQSDIVFLEASVDDFRSYFIIKARESLESKALIIFKRESEVNLIPVGMSFNKEYMVKLKMEVDWLYEVIDFHSTAFFRSKCEEITLKRRNQAFAYINSDQYSQDQKDLDQEKEKIVHGIGDLRLIKIHQKWNEINRLREKVMLTNIHQYSLSSNFEKAVFMIGAAHRYSLRDQIEKFEGNGIKWHYFSMKDSG